MITLYTYIYNNEDNLMSLALFNFKTDINKIT